MAFFNRAGGLISQGAKINASVGPAPMSSMLNTIRCISSKLFIGGLSYNTDDASLKDAFSGFGEVTEAKVIADRESGRSRGFGFVSFSETEAASSAVSAMDGQALDGRNIRVSFAQERAPGPRGGGGNFGSYGGGGGGGYGGGSRNFE